MAPVVYPLNPYHSTFSIWQVQPDNGGQYPYWLSDNHTIVEKLDGAGHLARGNITEAQ